MKRETKIIINLEINAEIFSQKWSLFLNDEIESNRLPTGKGKELVGYREVYTVRYERIYYRTIAT